MAYDDDVVACVCEAVAYEAGLGVDEVTTDTPLVDLNLSRLAPEKVVLVLEKKLGIETQEGFESEVFGAKGATVGTLVSRVSALDPQIRKVKPSRPGATVRVLKWRLAKRIKPVMRVLVPGR